MPLNPVPNFPNSLDSLPDPTATIWMDDDGFEQDLILQKHNAILEAIEAKLGIGSSVPGATAAVLRRTAAGTSAWGQIVGGDIAPAAKIAITPLAAGGGGAANRFVGTTDGITMAFLQVASAMIAPGAVSVLSYVTVPTTNGSGAGTTVATVTTPAWSGTDSVGLLIFSSTIAAPTAGASVQLNYQMDSGAVNLMLGPYNHPVANQALPVTAIIPLISLAAGSHAHKVQAVFAAGGSWTVASGYAVVLELKK